MQEEEIEFPSENGLTQYEREQLYFARLQKVGYEHRWRNRWQSFWRWLTGASGS